MELIEFDFGKTQDDQRVFGYEVSNSNGISLKVFNYGATLISLKMPDKTGISEEVTPGFNSAAAIFWMV